MSPKELSYLNRNTAWKRHCVVLRNILICGFCGSFQKMYRKNGRLLLDLRDWGGNKRVGVFATRSPFRPNPIGLTAVRFIGVEQTKNKGAVLRVAGVDLMNGTPIYDIKPYLPYADSIPEASLGFAGEHLMDVIEVVCSDELWGKIPEDKRGALEEVLSQDPRPAYHEDETRKYGMEFAGFDIIFHVKEKVLYVDEIKKGNLTTKSKLL